jgi:hypothetical protein
MGFYAFLTTYTTQPSVTNFLCKDPLVVPHFLTYFLFESNTFKSKLVYKCEWKECDCEPQECLATFKRHVRFHAFHTKLKQIGQNVLQKLESNLDLENNPGQQVPRCNLDDTSRNIIPELPYRFECAWDTCSHSTDNPELFYRHIKVNYILIERKPGTTLKVLILDFTNINHIFQSFTL